MIPSTVIAMFMKEFDFHGPAMSVSATCASGNVGMLTAKSWIDSGIASDVILLATDLSGIPENIPWFSDLGAAVLDLPPFEGCRPFQEGSRGFVGGEASVAMVLSSRPGGAYVSVLGGAMTNDAYHAIALAPDNAEIFRCFREATANADVSPSDVAYLNAHGPGTAQCDSAEAKVLDELYPRGQGDLLDQAAGGALPGRGRGGRDARHALRLRDRGDPVPAPGGAGASEAARREHATPAWPHAQVVDRHGRAQRRSRGGRAPHLITDPGPSGPIPRSLTCLSGSRRSPSEPGTRRRLSPARPPGGDRSS